MATVSGTARLGARAAARTDSVRAGARVWETLRWLGRLWFAGWTQYVAAVRPRRPDEV